MTINLQMGAVCVRLGQNRALFKIAMPPPTRKNQGCHQELVNDNRQLQYNGQLENNRNKTVKEGYMYLEYLNTQRLSCVKPADFKTIEQPREDVFQEYIIMTLYMADFKYPRLLNGNGCLLECVNKEFLWEFK